MEIQELYDILVGTLFPKDITDHLESQGFPGDPIYITEVLQLYR